MSNQKQHLVMRFGFGLRPGYALPQNADAMIREAVAASQRQCTITTRDAIALHKKYIDSKRSKAVLDEAFQIRLNGLKRIFTDSLDANTGFGDRLMMFWCDHFSARGAHPEYYGLTMAYMQEAIRNRMMGSFYDLLASVITHPTMLLFLNQDTSSGQNSPAQKKLAVKQPANENLARELLELHTMGSRGPYTQQDVTQTALLLSGLRYTHWTGFEFNAYYAEPGPKRILGTTYNPQGATPSISHIHSLLRTLSMHPHTIDTICRKLLVHFVSDTVDVQMLQVMKNEWMRTNGHLTAVCSAMIKHPNVNKTRKQKVKRPLDYVISSLRAISTPSVKIQNLQNWQFMDWLYTPISLMGQTLHNVPGPNGWPEDPASWIHPAGYASRIEWAHNVPSRIMGGPNLPNPANIVQQALGHYASPELVLAVPRGASRKESTTVLLASNDFNRR